ncbi:MAG: PEP/pyruvate-binding domain-containing protein, partial [Bacteroidales bacterium]|nr:PEP/pyruvate-binding domain-containing protein [Bacteroidales bacterium]
GGKARGLAFMNSVLQCSDLHKKYPGFNISIPSTVVISTDVFDEFMEMNHIYKEEIIDKTDDEILKIFQKAKLPESLLKDIWAIGHLFKNPIAIRSSSKLEDSHYQPFAGVYKTFMIPSHLDDDLMARMIESAIKSVYASVFYKNSRAYMLATTNVIDEEKMGIIIQEVCGTRHGDLFYPTISGVARSVNFYPIPPEKPNRGIVNLAFGLGKYIVDGNVSLRFSPDYPDKIIQLSTPKMALHGTQHDFIALDLGQEHFTASTNDSVNLVKLSFDEIDDPKIHRYLSSVFDYENQVIRDRFDTKGQKVLTFAPILKYRKLPLAKLLSEILEMSEKAFNNAVEIEFAIELDLKNNKVHNFSYLQVRPIISSTHYLQSEVTKEQVDKAFIHSTKASGNGLYDEISDLLVVDFTDYDPKESGKIVKELEEINKEFVDVGKGYVLAGPGRWGSSDSKLGVPVQWSQISAARVIIEIANSTLHTEPSQGTHF